MGQSRLGGAGGKVPPLVTGGGAAGSATPPSLARAPGMHKPVHDTDRRGRFHLLLPAAGVTTQRQASEGGGKGGATRHGGTDRPRGQALVGESHSVLTLCPGDAAPFLGLRFNASTAASGPRSRHLA